ncbi:MAG: spore germination protein [Oscillospiraceae bacterium]|nr:spore germination protein [Oscillospiraceae bacterium]
MAQKDTGRLSASLRENLIFFRTAFDESSDFLVREFSLGGTDAALFSIDNLADKTVVAQSILNPLLSAPLLELEPDQKLKAIRSRVLSTVDQKLVYTREEVLSLVMSGFVVLALDGCDTMIAMGVQGFAYRTVGESDELMQNGSREGFVEVLQVNQSMIRRRIKNANLKFEAMTLGTESKTQISLCYLRDRVSPEALRLLKKNLSAVDLRMVLSAEYLLPYLERPSVFSGIGDTDRPDTLCGKISEGRIAILVDGTPHALIVPYLFIENFQTADDYAYRPFYATLVRWIKYFSFFLSTFLPGIFVAAATFTPALIPPALLGKIAQAEAETPFTIFVEVLLLNFIYEIMREAGLRVPKSLSHAVSIVGALVIGDAAVNSGLIGAPTLMVIALTALASYVTPKIYEPLSFLRLLFILVGGILGIGGILVGFAVVLVNLCAKSVYKVPINAPISPFSKKSMRDVLFRANWKNISKNPMAIQDLPGSNLPHEADKKGGTKS